MAGIPRPQMCCRRLLERYFDTHPHGDFSDEVRALFNDLVAGLIDLTTVDEARLIRVLLNLRARCNEGGEEWDLAP